MTTAQEAFDAATADGASPEDAFEAAGDAVREAVGEGGDSGDMDEAAMGDMPPPDDTLEGGEGDDTLEGGEGGDTLEGGEGGDSRDVNPLEAIGEAAGAAFGEALADGATAEDAFTSATDAASATASDLGMSEEISGPVIASAQEAFDAAIADGASPEDAFEAAGDGAREAYGNPLEAVGEAASVAFEEALADGATAEDAFTSATDAASATASDYGFSAEQIDPVMTTAQEAFDAATADGASPEDAFEAAGDAVREAVGEGGDSGDMDEADGGMEALAGALEVEPDETPMDGGEMTDTDDALGAAMDAAADQGGAPPDDIASDSGEPAPEPEPEPELEETVDEAAAG
jgi:hypothetical protein